MNADAVAALPWGEYIAKLAATPCLAFREPWSCLNEPEEDGSPEAPMWERDELCPPCLVRAARAALAAAPLPSEPTHPHDGFAYDGCKCVCCVNIRALANPAIIEERDRAEEWADRLAYAIGGAAIGEHSNLNNPWQNALDMAAPLPSEPESVYDFAWLIERGQPEGQVPTVWWWLAAGGREGWTEVATEAFHFESREAAEEIIAAKFTPPTSRGEASARAVEHSFIAATPLPSDTPADGLDVERLTRALWVVEFEAEEGPYEHASEANVIDVTGLAEAIAHEYAALALTQEPRSGADR